MLAVAHALRARGPAERPPGSAPARIVASFGDLPFEIPRILRFLPGADLLSPPDVFPQRPQVMVTFDVASVDRLGMLEASAAAAEELIVLDHHASNTGFGTVNLVDPAAAATAVLACDLIDRLGVDISRDMALGLYTGLVTDTGSVRDSTATPWGARLAGAGVGARRRAGRGGAGSVIDVVRRSDEADVAVVLKEDDHGNWQASVRSKGRADVGRACVALGGGGHSLAAGFTAHGPADEVMTALRQQLADGPPGPDQPGAMDRSGQPERSGAGGTGGADIGR